jgi:hypothetical protein
MKKKLTALSLIYLVSGLVLFGATATDPLPTGNSGIASRYPSDKGIGSDPAVIFADDFESYSDASGLTSRWDEAYHNIRISTEAGNFSSGAKALEFTVPQTSSEVSNTVLKYVNPAQDVLFVRYYAKFDPNSKMVGSSHNGSSIWAKYCCPGVPADGYNKFFVSYEAGRESTAEANPGRINTYVYYPDQRDSYGDHFFPTGIVVPYTNVAYNWGLSFVSRPDITPPTGRWNSYEMMVRANTPGQRDGRIALWMDGNLIADFMNLRLRETTNLKIDKFSIDMHAKSNTGGVAKKWYDNVVAATSYIGPMATTGSTAPRPPTNVRIIR